jgi:uncharacterized protein
MYEIVLGRNESDRKKLGLEGTVFIGKHYVKMGAVRSLSNQVLLDIARTHVALIAGKRGTGKSYSLGSVAEQLADLPSEIGDKLAVLIFDTMGIFWTMKYPNIKDEDLLRKWGLKPQGAKARIFMPAGYIKEQEEKGIPVDAPFTINPKELSPEDWASVFNVSLFSEVGIAIDRAVETLEEKEFELEEIITTVNKDKRITEKTKLATENLFNTARNWKIFSKDATPIKELVKGGQTTILDVSVYDEWNIKSLVVGLVCKKLFKQRMLHRKEEEVKDIEKGHSYFATTSEDTGKEMPLVWLMLDEAHEMLPKEGKTPATDALVTILREGRQPGISLIMATQQPGEIHKDAITQSDIVLSHRVTAKKDIDALNSIMQTYLSSDINTYLNNLPHLKGSAIVLDDNSEKIYPIQIKPKSSWHGGEAPSAVKPKSESLKELGI